MTCKHQKLIRKPTGGYQCASCNVAIGVTLPPQTYTHDFHFDLRVSVSGSLEDCQHATREDVLEALTESLQGYDSYLTVSTMVDEDEVETEFEVTDFDLREFDDD